MRFRLVSGYAAVWMTLFILGVVVCLWQWYSTVRASLPSTPVLFDHGLTPFETRIPKAWTNEFCKSCHITEYAEWKHSRHAVSGTNLNFRVECLTPGGGRKLFCMNCHAPRHRFQRGLPTQEPMRLDEVFDEQPLWLINGVDCISCHVRDGEILAVRVTPSGRVAHPMRVSPLLQSPEFCGSCHQFGFKEDDLPDRFRGQQQQASLDEYLDFRRAHEVDERCQDCHMPAGDHTMRGGYDFQMIQSAFDLELQLKWLPVEKTDSEDTKAVELLIAISADGVGHRVPGGEHFRYLTLHTNLYDADGKPLSQPSTRRDGGGKSAEGDWVDSWPQVETMRRIMKAHENGLAPDEPPNPDTRLHPGETRRFRYLVQLNPAKVKFPIRARSQIKYHLMSDEKAAQFHHNLDKIITTIHETEAQIGP